MRQSLTGDGYGASTEGNYACDELQPLAGGDGDTPRRKAMAFHSDFFARTEQDAR